MNIRNTNTTGILTFATLATALSLWSSVTLAEPAAPAQTGVGKPEHFLLAYSARNSQTYRSIRKTRQIEPTSFSSLETRVTSAAETKAEKRVNRRHHHGSPYSRKH